MTNGRDYVIIYNIDKTNKGGFHMYLLFSILFPVLVIFLLIAVITIIVFAQKEKSSELPKMTFKRRKKKK
ncbi:hypothetical protein WRP3_013 [Lactococcus phage WRP3]|uniref:Uncharacterized protein n=1 Tax=Lactococcus phage WRP3 TaxID=1560313 RepID=A0A0D3MT39_9CAUD|nr:hypothetical protein ACQ37_gp013 [Lactococcus phage WRP3]AIX12516.1 hypothetical protein WRP3_013 [Lactococcus phage WRP3]